MLLENMWMESKKKKMKTFFKSRADMSDVVQNLLVVWASRQDMLCFWIQERLVGSRVAVTSQTLGLFTCLDLSIFDLRLLKCTFGGVFCPLTVETRRNLTDITRNLWLFSCFLSTYFWPELTKAAQFNPERSLGLGWVQLQHPCWFHTVFTSTFWPHWSL